MEESRAPIVKAAYFFALFVADWKAVFQLIALASVWAMIYSRRFITETSISEKAEAGSNLMEPVIVWET
jgi:hypothetical protein